MIVLVMTMMTVIITVVVVVVVNIIRPSICVRLCVCSQGGGVQPGITPRSPATTHFDHTCRRHRDHTRRPADHSPARSRDPCCVSVNLSVQGRSGHSRTCNGQVGM